MGVSASEPSLYANCQRAFVAIRPPGHHCGEDTPSGFCFVNNVAVGAAHGMFPAPIFVCHCSSTTAYLQHDIDRVIILDIDLHHGTSKI
jgi:histone deacetylase HOS3